MQMTFQAFTVPYLRLYLTAIYGHGDPLTALAARGSWRAARSPTKELALLRRWSIPLTTLALVVGSVVGGSMLAAGGASAAVHPAAHHAVRPAVRGWNPGGVMHHEIGRAHV